MKKLIWLLFAGMSLSVSAQSYEELTDQALDYMEQDSLVKAEELFRQAMKLEPANPRNGLLFSNIGIIQRQMRKYNEALESFTYALNLFPQSIPILLNRGAVLMELGLTDRAYIDYCQVLDFDKNDIEALLMRAYIYVIRRDYKAARLDYNRLLVVEPLNYSGRLGLVTLNQKEKKYTMAMEMITQLIEEFPEDITVYLIRAGIETELEQYDAAILDYEKAIKLNPDNSDVYLHRGELYLLQNKKALAKQDFEKAILLGIPQSELREQLRKCR